MGANTQRLNEKQRHTQEYDDIVLLLLYQPVGLLVTIHELTADIINNWKIPQNSVCELRKKNAYFIQFRKFATLHATSHFVHI